MRNWSASKVLARQPRGRLDLRRMADALGWGPVVDGKILPEHPFEPAPGISANVPLLVGTTLNEFVHNINNPSGEAMTEDRLMKSVTDMHGERAKQVIDVFKARTPHASPFDLWSRIASAPVRGAAIEQCPRTWGSHAVATFLGGVEQGMQMQPTSDGTHLTSAREVARERFLCLMKNA